MIFPNPFISSISSFPSFLFSTGFTVVCFFCAFFAIRRSLSSNVINKKIGGKDHSKFCRGIFFACGGEMGSLVPDDDYSNGNDDVSVKSAKAASAAIERQAGGSMMEQLVPEITTHALSYLDYPSLCRLSMTNSSMRRAANDDNAWKMLYHKDFTLEQDNIVPDKGWKAYYASTKAVVTVNTAFFNVITERSAGSMRRLWLNADYVKCILGSGQFGVSLSGYNAIIERFEMAIHWVQDEGINFDVQDVRTRITGNMAWVTMKAYVEIAGGPFHVTNIFEFHNGQWLMVHHHSSGMLVVGGITQHQLLGLFEV
ncbi:F-box protein SKIP8 [Zostera marina]|uniref:F-box protein SKIP8 n=1 Tax=Zostera marina TaxID=29655 RepID=A0A0K9PD71_ZOSMR|nr:F-box protein SKIP8 [Zostera marina]